MSDKIELSAECVKALVGYVRNEQWFDEDLLKEARDALTEHEAEKNPLGLPWSDNGDGYLRDGNNNHLVACSVNVAQYKLIAHAPKLAECLAKFVRSRGGGFSDEARQLLRDCGWSE